MMHFLITIPLLALLCLVLPYKYRFLAVIIFAILCNIPFFNHLSLCDIIFSFSADFSLFSLIFFALFIMQSLSKKQICFINQKGILLYIIFSLCIFLSFLGLIPIELYYLDARYSIALAFIIIVVMYFFDFILASLLAVSLLGYGLSLFDYSNTLDYLFDAPSLVLFTILWLKQKLKWQK